MTNRPRTKQQASEQASVQPPPVEALPAFRRQLLPPGFCLNCGHHEEAHRDGPCDHEISDYGDMDCNCNDLRLCAACEGDPEAHGMHVCGREHGC